MAELKTPINRDDPQAEARDVITEMLAVLPGDPGYGEIIARGIGRLSHILGVPNADVAIYDRGRHPREYYERLRLRG